MLLILLYHKNGILLTNNSDFSTLSFNSLCLNLCSTVYSNARCSLAVEDTRCRSSK